MTVLTITVALLRFYDEQDFSFLGSIALPRLWSNRLTVAAIVVAVVNFGVEWDRRNRETDRLAAEERRRVWELERTVRRTRIEARYPIAQIRIAQIRFQLDPSTANRQVLTTVLAILEEYGQTL